MKVYPLGIVGESHYQAAISRTCSGETARIFHEPSNPYDPLALRVDNILGETIGYVPASSWLRRAIHEDGRGVASMVAEINQVDGGYMGVVLNVTLTDDPVHERKYVSQAADLRAKRSARPRRKPGEAALDKLDGVIALSNAPITCECTAQYDLNIAGLTPDTVLTCPHCKRSYHLPPDDVTRLLAEFVSAARQFLTLYQLTPPSDDQIRAKVRSTPSKPPRLIRRPDSGGTFKWKRLFKL